VQIWTIKGQTKLLLNVGPFFIGPAKGPLLFARIPIARPFYDMFSWLMYDPLWSMPSHNTNIVLATYGYLREALTCNYGE
jgi:hypothetical protein